MLFGKVCNIIYKHYGVENIKKITKKGGTNVYVLDFKDGSCVRLTLDDIFDMI